MLNQLIRNYPHGYYSVGDQLYVNKTEAVYNATISSKPLEWHFHDHVFSNLDWSARPAGTLADMYRERAQQIRDKYDHVIVYFSGGMDSWQVLDSFLSNGIHIDEIVTRWLRAERKFYDVSTSTDQSNMGSEYEYAVLPVLEHIRKNYPSINIVDDDFSECLEGEITEADFNGCNNWQNMPAYFKYTRRTAKELEMEKKNKSVGVVIGADKIHVSVTDGNFYAHFTDQSTGSDLDPRRKLEMFYWTPDFPLLPVLQAHYLKDAIKEKRLLDPNFAVKKSMFKNLYQEVCYPKFNIDTFQVKKPHGTLFWKNDYWIYKYNPRYYESWRWITKQYYEHIDEQYLNRLDNNLVAGIKIVDSPRYLLETSTNLPNFKC